MATSAPPILPISTPQSTPPTINTAVQSSDPPIATPAFRSFITRLSDQVKDGYSQGRPWTELVDRSAFSKPESIAEATTRIRKNYSYFRVNYLAFLALVVGFSLVTHPFSLLTLAFLLAAWSFAYLFKPADRPLVILGRTYSDRETLGILVILSIVLIFLTNVGSVLMYAFVLGAAVVCVHGAFRAPEDLFLDDQDSAAESTGFLSFLGATTRSAAYAAAPAVAAARV
ncbi:PRA1 family protein B4-like [Chenopodium quinoa]|uniref:PRA1 family protein B4-like n=1 Tax=Chenopodium quinoa TaxID=63459 RepID=UPI000B78B63E|nr:PRA1 family protein B4-like [Chenopodium quinoa]